MSNEIEPLPEQPPDEPMPPQCPDCEGFEPEAIYCADTDYGMRYSTKPFFYAFICDNEFHGPHRLKS